MQNNEIRRAAGAAGVKLWEVADRMGMADANFSRKLRYELSGEEKEKILQIIKQIEREANRCG